MNKLIFITIILLLTGGGLFYWFEWRPSEARKECLKEVRNQAKKQNLSGSEGDVRYGLCLTEKGLPPESLITD